MSGSGEDYSSPVQKWCHLCGQIQQVVRGPLASECKPLRASGHPKFSYLPGVTPDCPLCGGNMEICNLWLPPHKATRHYWKCTGTYGYPYCRGNMWVDEMGEGPEQDGTEKGVVVKTKIYPEVMTLGPNCERCGDLMESHTSFSDKNFKRPYWYCHGRWNPPGHMPRFIWADECHIQFAGFDPLDVYGEADI